MLSKLKVSERGIEGDDCGFSETGDVLSLE